MKKLLIVALAITLLCFYGCSASSGTPLDTVKACEKALKDLDYYAYSACLDPDTAAYVDSMIAEIMLTDGVSKDEAAVTYLAYGGGSDYRLTIYGEKEVTDEKIVYNASEGEEGAQVPFDLTLVKVDDKWLIRFPGL